MSAFAITQEYCKVAKPVSGLLLLIIVIVSVLNPTELNVEP